MSTTTTRRARPRVRVGANTTYVAPDREARYPPITMPIPTHTATPERKQEEDEDIEAQEFEAAILARTDGSAIAVPGAACRARLRRAPLPLMALHALDAHAWARERGLLSMWARGAGIGACANSVTDAMFAPGSPPRTPVRVGAPY